MADDIKRSAMVAQGLSMEKMWHDVAVRFQNRAHTKLDLDPPRTLADCIKTIESRQVPKAPASSSEKKSPHEKAKTCVIDILHCLKLLGGVASKAVGTVFPPSELCFNALSLLLNIPADLHKFHHAVDGLFETLGPALSTFKIYEAIEQFDEIETPLKDAVHALMISFIDICSLSIELRLSGRWEKFKCGAKLIILDKDSGVKDEIAKFESLTKAHNTVQATQTLKVVLETNSKLTTFLNTTADTYQIVKRREEQRKSEESRARHLRNIKEKLGMEDESVVRASKAISDEHWRNTSCPMWCEHEDKDVPCFHKWMDRNDTNAASLFLLTGNSNTGKSVTMSWIADRLRAAYELRGSPGASSTGNKTSSRQSGRTLIASYFFPTNTTKNGTEKGEIDRPTIKTALKCIAVQFANADRAYAQKISTELDAKADASKFVKDASYQELWNLLGLGSPIGTAAHYLVIDGLPDWQQESCLGLLRNLKLAHPSSVRVMLSTKPDMGENIKKIFSRLYNVDVEDHSASDIGLYVDRELKADNILQEEDADSKALRTKVRASLSTGVRGNYFKVKTALDKIRLAFEASEGEAAIEAILNEANKDEKQISQAMIDTLKDELSSREIDELNEILTWVIFGLEWFNVEQLNAARFLRFNEPAYRSPGAKLTDRGKYAALFDPRSTRSSAVKIADGIEELSTKERTESKLQKPKDSAKFSVTITIEKAGFSTIQSFLWSFAQRLTQEQYTFERADDQFRTKGSIQVNSTDSHLIISQRAFALLAAQPDKRTEALAPYLLNYLPQHLEKLAEATGLDMLSDSQKQEIGDGLFSLFDSGEVVERHWDSCNEPVWFRDRAELDIFLGWLKDPVVVGSRSNLDRKWLKKVFSSSSDPHGALLTQIMRTVAKQWLERRSWAVERPFEWLQEFMEMRKGDDDDLVPTGVSNVEIVADWCRKELGVKKEDQLWDERLAETLYAEGQYFRAIEKFSTALLNGSSIKLLRGLANSLAGENRYLEACQRMEEALAHVEDCLVSAAVRNDRMNVAEWYCKLKLPRRAIACLSNSLTLDPEFHEGRYKLLQILFDCKDMQEAAKLLYDVAKVELGKPCKLGQMIEYMVHDADQPEKMFGKCFSLVFLDHHALLLEPTLREMDAAIDRAREHDIPSDLSDLLLYKGVAIYYYPNVQEFGAVPKESAVDIWSQSVKAHDGSAGGWSSSHYATSLISAHHFEQSRMFPDQEQHIKELTAATKIGESIGLSTASAFLACYFAQVVKQVSSVREAVQTDIVVAFDMLSDDTYENDWHGYYDLGVILMHCGDMLNAVSAFSLCRPRLDNAKVIAGLLHSDNEPENAELSETQILSKVKELIEEVKERRVGLAASSEHDMPNDEYEEIHQMLVQPPENEDLRHVNCHCKAGCGRDWNFDTAMNQCKFCYDTGFCDSCLLILKNGEMNKHWSKVHALTCSKDHEYMRLEKWDKPEYVEYLMGNVLVGGKLEGVQRIGGRLVPISTWLDGLKQEWGYTG